MDRPKIKLETPVETEFPSTSPQGIVVLRVDNRVCSCMLNMFL